MRKFLSGRPQMGCFIFSILTKERLESLIERIESFADYYENTVCVLSLSLLYILAPLMYYLVFRKSLIAIIVMYCIWALIPVASILRPRLFPISYSKKTSIFLGGLLCFLSMWFMIFVIIDSNRLRDSLFSVYFPDYRYYSIGAFAWDNFMTFSVFVSVVFLFISIIYSMKTVDGSSS